MLARKKADAKQPRLEAHGRTTPWGEYVPPSSSMVENQAGRFVPEKDVVRNQAVREGLQVATGIDPENIDPGAFMNAAALLAPKFVRGFGPQAMRAGRAARMPEPVPREPMMDPPRRIDMNPDYGVPPRASGMDVSVVDSPRAQVGRPKRWLEPSRQVFDERGRVIPFDKHPTLGIPDYVQPKRPPPPRDLRNILGGGRSELPPRFPDARHAKQAFPNDPNLPPVSPGELTGVGGGQPVNLSPRLGLQRYNERLLQAPPPRPGTTQPPPSFLDDLSPRDRADIMAGAFAGGLGAAGGGMGYMANQLRRRAEAAEKQPPPFAVQLPYATRR